MKKLNFILIIIIFFFKTGNVLSNNSIFNVDNIEIDRTKYENEGIMLDEVLYNGFIKLINRILLKDDIEAVSSTNINQIRNIISHYQITNSEDKNLNDKTKVNILFDREQINKFFYKQNISYADISDSKIVIFPILIENDNFYLYSNNYFYKNWNNKEADKNKHIEYILPVEDLESYEIIKNNFNDLEKIDISKLLNDYDIKDYVYIIINNSKNKLDIFIKGKISNKEVVKSISFKNNNSSNIFENAIASIKKEIIEIIKSQNLIDVRTPSFLNVNFILKEKKDLLNIQNILTKIEVIESFSVQELKKDHAKIKIKYYGKLGKIKEKFIKNGVKIKYSRDVWSITLI